MKLFQSATIRLTMWYVAILFVLCLLFSSIVYTIGTNEFRREPPRGGFGRYQTSFDDEVREAIRSERQARASESSRRLLTNLFIFNLIALASGGTCAYFFAKHTLRPIEDAMESQVRFSSDAAHELRTPLSVMQSEIEIALRDKSAGKKTLEPVLRSNLEEVTRLQSLTTRLLMLSNSDPVATGPTRLDEAVTDAINNVLQSALKKKISINNEVGKVVAVASREVLADIITILLDNAIKYSPAKSEIKVVCTEKNRSVDLSVVDQGIGIDAKDKPHIFDRFYRADMSRTKDDTEGYGLGLALAKRLAGSMSGDLSVKSTKGKGSTFTISLAK